MIKKLLIAAGVAAAAGAGAYIVWDRRLLAQKEVFCVPSDRGITQRYFATAADAEEVAKLFGGTVATEQQITDAWKKGAEWCTTGWYVSADGSIKKAGFPMQHLDPGGGCGSVAPLNQYIDPSGLAAVTVYGIKPKSTDPSKVFKSISVKPLPFNSVTWFAPTK